MAGSSEKTNRIIVLGNNWHGHLSNFLHYNLEQSGHNSWHFNTLFLSLSRFKIINKIKNINFIKDLNHSLLNLISREKISLIISVTPYNISPDTWQFIKNKNIPVLSWACDDPYLKSDVRKSFPFCRHIFLGDPAWVEKNQYLYPHSSYLPSCADPKTFCPLEKYQERKDIDILFVGSSFDGDNDGVFRASVLETVFKTGANLKLYGDPGWLKLLSRFPFLKDVFINQTVNSEELNALYNRSKISLNIHHSQMIIGTSQRTFEITASESFLLADYRAAIKTFYGSTGTTFNSSAELTEKIKYFLIHDSERQELAAAARQITLANHTYRNRIDRLLNCPHGQ